MNLDAMPSFGMTCISPTAPLDEYAWGFPPLSCIITAPIRLGLRPVFAAVSSIRLFHFCISLGNNELNWAEVADPED